MESKILDVTLEELKGFLKDELDREVLFQVCDDEIFTYHLINTPFEEYESGVLTGFEINIIADDIFYASETINTLIHKKRISYLGVSQYDENNRISEVVSYRPLIVI